MTAREIKARLDQWRDGLSSRGRGCGCLFLLLIDLLFFAPFFGSVYGDLGGTDKEIREGVAAKEYGAWIGLLGLSTFFLVAKWLLSKPER